MFLLFYHICVCSLPLLIKNKKTKIGLLWLSFFYLQDVDLTRATRYQGSVFWRLNKYFIGSHRWVINVVLWLVGFHSHSYCLMHRSVTFDFQFAFGMKPSDITFALHRQLSMVKMWCHLALYYAKHKLKVKSNTSMHQAITVSDSIQ